MIIVMIHWKIVPDGVEEFLEFWRKEALIIDRRGLVGEFLTEEQTSVDFKWITWQLTGCERKYKSFVNVGYWKNSKEFHEQVGKYFETSTGKRDFEYELRVRTVLKPKCWRMGDYPLPIHDSGGVL